MHFVKIYVYHHTKLLLRQIRYKESCFHVKLLCYHRRRHHAFILSNTADVYPRIIVDVPKVSLNRNELDYLSRTGKLEIRCNTDLDCSTLYHPSVLSLFVLI
jgi:hypothetical protein